MNIAVVGTGYVGLVTGTCLAEVGHQVICVDIDAAKVQRMQGGEIPIYEPGLEEIVKGVLSEKRLAITTDLASAVADAAVVFLALPTPSGADGSADLSAVLKVAEQLGPLLKQYAVVVDKSTVPVGTAEQVRERIAGGASVEFDVVSNPEFLREGLALQDFMHPDRIVIGSDSERALAVMHEVYSAFITEPEQLVFMSTKSAEMTKYAANAFLAMKVTFMNEIANLAELVGADVADVRRGIGPDQRIGKQFLGAGIGYGGSCFPKDVRALNFTAQEHGYTFRLLDSIIGINSDQKRILTEKLRKYYDGQLKDKKIALWGLSFKPDTDDIREAPSLEIIDALLKAGAVVTAYDPEAMDNVRTYFGDREGLQYADRAMDAVQGADALLIATEWEAFRAPDFAVLKERMARPVIFDGRNLYDPVLVVGHGLEYFSIGRPQ